MKKLILLLLLTGSLYAQPQVFNVQRYDVDEKPFSKNVFDISGNEYSFVFLDDQKKEVVFFFTNTKLRYDITAVQSHTDRTVYQLEDGINKVEMKLNKAKTRIEFHYPDTRIYLQVGKSTKAGT